MEDIEDPEVLDAGMIGSAQAVEHYEITRYGTLIAWAKQLGRDDAIPAPRGQSRGGKARRRAAQPDRRVCRQSTGRRRVGIAPAVTRPCRSTVRLNVWDGVCACLALATNLCRRSIAQRIW